MISGWQNSPDMPLKWTKSRPVSSARSVNHCSSLPWATVGGRPPPHATLNATVRSAVANGRRMPRVFVSGLSPSDLQEGNGLPRKLERHDGRAAPRLQHTRRFERFEVSSPFEGRILVRRRL